MDHPTLRSGITDEQTTLVAAAGTFWDAEELRRILNPGNADIETFSEGTELLPDLKISIIRTGSKPNPRTGEGVKDATGLVVEIMQLPLPVSRVIVVMNDKTGNKGYGATNHGYAFSFHVKLEQEFTSDFLPIIVHESLTTTGVVWKTGLTKAWPIHSGTYTASKPELLLVLANKRAQGTARPTTWKCCQNGTLELKTKRSSGATTILGGALFRELLENHGQRGLLRALRELYRLALATEESGGKAGIAEVRQAFPDQAEIVEKHWSGKLNAPENR